MEKAFTVVLEGITVQHAAELFFDYPPTHSILPECRYSYLHSLESVIFAVIVADQVATSYRLPERDGTKAPGTALIEHLDRHLPNKFIRLDEKAAPSPDLMLADAVSREAISHWLGRYSFATSVNTQAWKNHFAREAVLYLGHDGSLSQALPSEQYRFPRAFWPDQQLESLVPAVFVEQAIAFLPALLPVTGLALHPNAARTFIRRNAVAHVLLWRWYQDRVINKQLPSLRRNNLTHLTRATFLHTANENGREALVRKGWHVVLPRLGAVLMRKARTAAELLQIVMDYSSSVEAKRIRSRWADSIHEFAAGNESALERIKKELESWYSDEQAREGFTLSADVSMDGTLMPRGGLSISKSFNLPLTHEDLERSHQFITRVADQYGSFEDEALRLFPRLVTGC